MMELVVTKFQRTMNIEKNDSAFHRLWKAAEKIGCTPRSIPEDVDLLLEGTVDENLHLLRSGCLQACQRRGKRSYTLQVFLEGDVFTSMDSFVQGTPSVYGIRSVEASVVMDVSRPRLERMLKDDPMLGKDIAEHHRQWISRLTDRVLEIINVSPMERYVKLSRDRPELVDRLPQYMIASMLGITPESLSRIRRRLSDRS